jgi:hypothetical protein
MSLDSQYMVMLQGVLDNEYIPHLPPLLDITRPADDQLRKNRSRAFSAFVLHNHCEIPKIDAAKAVIDDYDDYGVDAIYFHAASDTLYLVQSKLKAAEQFSQEEALAYCQGVRKLIKQDFNGFNQHLQDRKVEVEDALDDCSHIKLIVAHTGSGVSRHAKHAIDELFADEDHGEERLENPIIDYDSNRVVESLRLARAYGRVDTDLWVQKCSTVSEPRITYFGLIQLEDLVKLHGQHGKALYERNIRTFLGKKTDVNIAIRDTLVTKPQDFLYLNNGVTVLCQDIQPKGAKKAQGGHKRLKIRGLSVINGAQTIASSARLLEDNDAIDISTARVALTLIKADTDGSFGKSVTRARNHQNPVHFSHFVALDDEQERLRRELALLGIHYVYKPEGADGTNDPKRIRIDEAAQALSMLQVDPRYVVWVKKEPTRLLDTNTDQYKALFSPGLTAFQLANSVFLNRYIQKRMSAEALHASGLERLVYKHGNFAVAWVLSKRIKTEVNSAALLDDKKLKTSLSAPFDQLRQAQLNQTVPRTMDRGPLSLFRNQTCTLPLLGDVLIEHYGLTADPVVGHKRGQQRTGQPYPKDLFDYLISRAPQIRNLT